MQKIKEYIFSLMIIAFSCAIIELLSPENKGMSKYLHFTAALVICTVILSPIQSLLGVLPDIFDIDLEVPALAEYTGPQEYTDIIINESIDKVKAEIKNELVRKFRCEPCEVDVGYDASDVGNIIITGVRIGYEVSNRYLFSDTENYIEEMMKCDCEVYFCNG